MTVRPLLLIDVDGPLNPWRLITRNGYLPPKVRPGEPVFEYDRHALSPVGFENLLVLLSKAHGEALNALADVFTLIWATTWEDDANIMVGPLIGLPDLPVIKWPGGGNSDGARNWALLERHRGSWKTKHIARWLDDYAPGVPWAWIDDDVNGHDRAWLRRHYGVEKGEPLPVPHLLCRVEPTHGLRALDFTALREWAEGL